jgi:hypothetical protein
MDASMTFLLTLLFTIQILFLPNLNPATSDHGSGRFKSWLMKYKE